MTRSRNSAAYAHDAVVLSHKNGDILIFAIKWMELEMVLWTEVSQMHNTNMFSPICVSCYLAYWKTKKQNEELLEGISSSNILTST